MPAHNEQDYLQDAVGRVVAALRGRDLIFEVLVCENGSTDDTVAVGTALAETYPEVRTLHSPTADYGQRGTQRVVRASGSAARSRTSAGSVPSTMSCSVTTSSTVRRLARRATQTSVRRRAEPS